MSEFTPNNEETLDNGYLVTDRSGYDNDEVYPPDGLAAERPPRKRRRQRSTDNYDVDQSMQWPIPEVKNPRHVVHHHVYCDQPSTQGHSHAGHTVNAIFLDVPRMFARDSRASPLRGRDQIFDLNIYQHHHDDVTLVVRKFYSCVDYHQSIHYRFTKIPIPSDLQSMGPNDVRPWFYFLKEDGPLADADGEDLIIHSEHLRRSMKLLTFSMPRTFREWEAKKNLAFPYSFFYHYIRDLRAFSQQLPTHNRRHISVLLDYIADSQSEDFGDADALFARGCVSSRHFGKLFKVDDIVVRKTEAGIRAFKIQSIVHGNDDKITLQCSGWDFDGRFYKTSELISLQSPVPDDKEKALHDLEVWPLCYDEPETRAGLLKRGQFFWTLKTRKLVQYRVSSLHSFDIRSASPRYMIDMPAYRDMHDDTEAADPSRIYLDDDKMKSKDPPDDEFALLLSPEIKGFGFHDKIWRTLRVSNMEEVKWNKRAFKRLVLKHSKKELIEALVKVHLGSAAPSDVIEDKGVGLIMLLHGPPGTGKTLTAESVAEIAEKPLYRITCGDMGTDPVSVEKYLESALYIGTLWECVVLLDEADVFLEERSQTDLVRNALVSVFLRRLEYYNGILILTSNRVGTFDEAFKSRMQLAVHYPTLTDMDRRRIWRDFFNTLNESGVNIEKEDLQQEIEKLAAHNFNGRQIRNVIKTARQLAVHRNQLSLRAKDLEDVIEVANDFDTYITDARGHSDEQWAAFSKMRANESKRIGR